MCISLFYEAYKVEPTFRIRSEAPLEAALLISKCLRRQFTGLIYGIIQKSERWMRSAFFEAVDHLLIISHRGTDIFASCHRIDSPLSLCAEVVRLSSKSRGSPKSSQSYCGSHESCCQFQLILFGFWHQVWLFEFHGNFLLEPNEIKTWPNMGPSTPL